MPFSVSRAQCRYCSVFLIEFAAAALLAAFNTPFDRPIWIDEFLHFCFGAMVSTSEAWDTIRSSTKGINHGQTGIYMLVNYWTLSRFGASSLILRLPSVLSGAVLFTSILFIFRTLGYSIAWRTIAVLATLGQATVIFYVGEARPYMPLAAATVAILAYYLVPPRTRTFWVGLCGVSAAIFGVAIHPYFAIYWPALCLVGYVHHRLKGQINVTIRSAVAYANAPLCAVGLIFFAVLSSETWLVGGPKFSFDPFQWISQPSLWHHFSTESHFQFLGGHLRSTAAVSVLMVGALIVTPRARRGELLGLLTPLLLLALALIISVGLAYASYARNYWILPRQWVASAVLISISVVWFWAEVAKVASRLSVLLVPAVWIFAAVAVLGQAAAVERMRLADFVDSIYSTRARVDASKCDPSVTAPDTVDIDEGNKLWVQLANNNISCGDGVWPVFRKYYGLK